MVELMVVQRVVTTKKTVNSGTLRFITFYYDTCPYYVHCNVYSY